MNARLRPAKPLSVRLLQALRVALLVAAVGSFALGGSAQDASAQRASDDRASSSAASGGAAQLERMAQAGAALEGPVDPQQYIVGPGDVFAVTLDVAQGAATAPVSADGQLLLPGAGSVPVAGLTLAEARLAALGALRRVYRNVGLEVVLVQPRQFFVHVTGAVARPGRFLAAPVARASSVVEQALMSTDSLGFRLPNPAFRPALRTVELRRADGTSQTLDLRRYYATGDTHFDPYLRDGDVLVVPAFDPATDAVTVSGAVASPGQFDVRDDDTIASVLRLTADDATLRRASGVRITRLGEGGAPETSMRSMREVLHARALLRVRPLDHIHVIPGTRSRGQVVAEGFVEYPGVYPIQPGETTVSDLVALAGGLRADARRRGAILVRATSPVDFDASFTPSQRVSSQASPGRFETVNLALRSSTLEPIGRNAFINAWLRERFAIVGAAETDATALRDGDRLIIPRDERAVYVFGQVQQPGFVPVREGMRAQDYVQAAGGVTSLGGTPLVIDAETYTYRSMTSPILSGDLIYVAAENPYVDSFDAERLRLERERYRSERAVRRTSLILQAASIATGIVTTVLLIRNAN